MVQIRLRVMIALCVGLGIPAMLAAQQQSTTHPDRTISASPGSNDYGIGVDETDKKFMHEAAIGDAAEIELGQMAQQQASDPQVKSFGRRMVKDHSQADDLLKNVAASQHVSLPTDLDPKHNDVKQSLSKLSGPAFDRAYMQMMVIEHTQDVSKFRQEASQAHDPAVKNFAAQSVPILESHLNEAKQIAAKLKSQ